MKINTITLLGALASANAGVIRGNAAAKKLAIMQKLTEAGNKKSSGAIRRQLEEENNNAQDDDNLYEGFTEGGVLTPGTCVTVSKANQYDGSTSSTSYMTFATGDGVSHASSLATYLGEIGASWVQEQKGMCEECQSYEAYCELSEEERAEMAEKFANMSDDEYVQYMQQEEEHQQQQQQQQQQKYEQTSMSSYISFMASGYGRRKLYAGFMDPTIVCETCEQKCEDGRMDKDDEEYYEELEEMFKNGVCTQVGDNQYMGPSCGPDGTTIEMALFRDQYCTSMTGASAYAYLDYIENGQDYMALLQELYSQDFSCSMGLEQAYKAAYEDNQDEEPSEACEGVFENSISENQCSNQNQYNQYNQYNNDEANNEAAEDGNGDNQDLFADCAEIFEQQVALENGKVMNAFTGKSYYQNGLSSGAIAGIAIAVIVVIAAGVALGLKSKKKKSELEEPVFQGGSLS